MAIFNAMITINPSFIFNKIRLNRMKAYALKNI